MVVVLDCNIWITLTINSQIDLISDLSNNGVIIASCNELRDEISAVLKKPKLTRFISNSGIDKVIELHDLVTTNFKPGKIISVTADLKDDYLFALSAICKADYFVTGDKLLLDVVKYKHTKVVSLGRFKS